MTKAQLKAESVLRGLRAGHDAWELVEGLYQSSYMVNVVERRYVKEVHSQAKYRLKKIYNVFGKEVLITAPGPAKLRPGSRYSLDFAVGVASDKYEYHLPLERQRRQMEALGLVVDVKTFYGLCEALAEHCDSVIPRIKKEIVSDFCAVHMDESPWRILGSNTSAYMWALSNRVGTVYAFEPSRSGDVALEILGAYEGSVMTDGFSGHNKFKNKKGVRVGNCWAHARREFYDLRDSYPEETFKIIETMDKFFEVERGLKSFDELRNKRKYESREIINRLYDLIVETRNVNLPRSGIVKACAYCPNRWTELTRFLDDLSIPFSNNDAERALRHVIMGRKNFSGSKSINGADVAASIYSVIESAKKAGLQPKAYLKYLVEERWFGQIPLTPQEYATKHGKPNRRIIFPERDQWKID